MSLRNKKGFTLIEVIVVAAIIAILAGILVPLIFKEIDESKISRASADVRSISNAMIVMRKDTGQWPTMTNANCTPAVTVVTGDGTLPTAGANWDYSAQDSFNNYLMTDGNGCWPIKWKGPYIAGISADPWGYAYVSNAKNYSGTGPLWIMSGGPNGKLETAADATQIDTVNSDDIGLRLR
jgi:general secretion pathway protein G